MSISLPFAEIRILITGASGNLGGELARLLAQPRANLVLWGRDESRLRQIADACREAGAMVSARSLDLADTDSAVAALCSEDEREPFDAIFLVAGCGDTLESDRVMESASQVLRLGLLNFVTPAALAAEAGERMARRGSGRIALIGSAAADHPLPFAAGYASSKAGLARFAHAARIALKPHGVRLTLITPGFFAPGHGHAYTYARPGEITAARVARDTLKAVAAGRAELIAPWPFAVLRRLSCLLPRPLVDMLMRRLPRP